MTLTERLPEYYFNQNYNCAESLIHACNDQYSLNLDDDSMKMMAGFGNGAYAGLNCGALIASVAALSRLIIKTKAHDQMADLSKADQLVVKNFQNSLGGTTCKEIKPSHFDKENRCYKTVELAARSLEDSLRELNIA